MMSEMESDGPLSDAEAERLRLLLKRYLSHELDQWETWKSETPYGPAYVLLSRALPDGGLPEYFPDL
ncbi:hypothetical protein ACFVXH_40845 [Kitasatospora sp. NPDC058184]|uniref:hypothetical protein n=1 Tax=Kitasatospora sp. NPDC058184 TaxID=3346370 RepID=UPI0036DE4FC8